MQQNSLSGTLSTTFSIGNTLESFNFHGNKLEGKISQSLTNCKLLEVLDVGDNHLNNTFPLWMGTLPELRVLSLRSNKLHGSIRTLTTENMFPKLRILYLSYNAFKGNLPTSLFQHLKAMRTADQKMNAPSYKGGGYYQDSVAVITKGFERYTSVDLSNNKFEGNIPSIMGDVVALHVLKLSHNGLQGHIPPSLGNLSVVESLDLSGAFLKEINFILLRTIHMKAMMDYVDSHFQKAVAMNVSDTNYTVYGLDDQESDSEFLNDFSKAGLMGYRSGLCIELSIVYLMISTGNPKWLARIIVELEHKVNMRRKKKQRHLRNNIRRNNPL